MLPGRTFTPKYSKRAKQRLMHSSMLTPGRATSDVSSKKMRCPPSSVGPNGMAYMKVGVFSACAFHSGSPSKWSVR